jgi:hypothetical protein
MEWRKARKEGRKEGKERNAKVEKGRKGWNGNKWKR